MVRGGVFQRRQAPGGCGALVPRLCDNVQEAAASSARKRWLGADTGRALLPRGEPGERHRAERTGRLVAVKTTGSAVTAGSN